jgi:hypothetical protein
MCGFQKKQQILDCLMFTDYINGLLTGFYLAIVFRSSAYRLVVFGSARTTTTTTTTTTVRACIRACCSPLVIRRS